MSRMRPYRHCWLLTLLILLLPSASIHAASWWKSTTIYQVYPRSFYDSNGDGIGDIRGLISKLDYIQELGFETIWVSPFYMSPQQDFGYDVQDYYEVSPEFGDMDDVRDLIREVHARQMYLVLDMVMNHTSDRHEWFRESAQSRDNPRADWYIWADGRGKGRPPTNWKSMIGGSGWHLHPARKQYYWASFLPFQPDLNYHHPEVRTAMMDVVRFWLELGADGFRLDIFNAIIKDPELRNNPFSFRPLPSEKNPHGFFQYMEHTVNHPGNFELAKELRQVTDEFGQPERMLLGEVFGKHEVLRQYLGNGSDGLHLVFLFDQLNFDFSRRFFREKIEDYQEHFPEPYMPTLVFGNHDRKRSISRIGNNPEKAKLLALYQLTARGVPVVYQGEEIGMRQSRIPVRKGQDPLAKRYRWIPEPLLRLSPESLNRDGCRTPMQWNTEPHAGFTAAEAQPWLPVHRSYGDVNVHCQREEPYSLWNCYRQLLALRKAHPALQTGEIAVQRGGLPPEVLAYTRRDGQEEFLVLANFGLARRQVEVPAGDWEMVFVTGPTVEAAGGKVKLTKWGGAVLRRK